MAITHEFVSGKTDGGDPTELQPSNWNEAHEWAAVPTISGTPAGAPDPADGPFVWSTTDEILYAWDGTDWRFREAGGAGGPKLYIEDTALHADGDEFDDDTLADWSLTGISVPSEVTAVTTEPYDDTAVDVVFAAQSDRLLRPITSGWTNLYLTSHGITNSTPSTLTAAGGMIGLCVVDANGDGTGVSVYNDNNAYVWAIDNYAYTGTGPQIISGALLSWTAIAGNAGSNSPIVYRLRKSGTSIYGALSFNGGLTWIESAARTDSLTHDRMGIIRLFSSGGTNPTMRLGRFNVAV